MQRSLETFKIVASGEALPTIEIDAATIEGSNYYEVLESCMVRFAEQYSDKSVSIYEHSESISFNFGLPTGGTFLIIARSKKLFNNIFNALESIAGLKFRRSDFLAPRLEELTYQIEGGLAWKREDLLTFQALAVIGREAAASSNGDGCNSDYSETIEDEQFIKPYDFADGSRKVGETARCIEEKFCLPKGSVCLLNPDRSPILGHAKIETLRERWQNNYKGNVNERPAWQQGNLDGLCGLYSCVNAIYCCIGDLTRTDCQKLFNTGIEYLAKNGMLKNAILQGISRKYIQIICNKFKPVLKEWDLTVETKWLTIDRKRINGIINDIKRWFEETDRPRSAIIGIGGKYDHWSCVSRGFDKQIIFDDSDGGMRINLEKFTASETVNKPYLIRPADVLGIEITSISE